MSEQLPEPLSDYLKAGQQPIPAHHRPPNVIYDDYGRPHHVVLGQPSQAPIIVQAPQPQGLDPATQRLIVITFLVVLVMVAVTACTCAIVVLMGGTLMGIIGAVGNNLTMLAVVLLGLVLAAGWTASKINARTGKKTKS